MPERSAPVISEAVHDAAADWVERVQRDASAQTAEHLEAWLAKDPAHRVAYRLANQGWRDGTQLLATRTGLGRQLDRAPFLQRHRTRVAMASVGGAALLGVMTVSVARFAAPGFLIPAAEADVYQTVRGELRTLTLSDGTRITLDTATRLVLHHGQAAPTVELSAGRARFETQNASHALTVVADGASFSTSSAAFDVDLASAGRPISVLRGTLRAEPAALVIHQGETVRGASVAPTDSATSAQVRWTTGMLALDTTRLDDAVAAINRYNDLHVVLGQPALAGLRMSGAFRVRDPQAFARAVAALYHLRISHPERDKIVLSPEASRP